jgi:hypothetical protein
MSHYFLLLDSNWFHDRFRPALAASWRQKSFQPCQALCDELTEAARAFSATYYVSTEGSLAAVAAGLPFDRHFWRCLVGEALLYSASEIPEIQMALESVTRLLAPGRAPWLDGPREQLAPIHQVHFGSRDLQFGSAIYRPEQVGMNDTEDVRRLSDYLRSLNPSAWTTADLGSADEFADVEGRDAELEYVRESFPALCQLYERANDRHQIIVCEST